MTHRIRERTEGAWEIWIGFLRLGAMVAVDLVRPARPENRLPKRWAPTFPPR